VILGVSSSAKRGLKKSVLAKMTCAPSKAGIRELSSSRSALTISTPLDASDLAASLDGFRLMPLTFHSGSERNVLATELPCH
jgi:hypothetical protein